MSHIQYCVMKKGGGAINYLLLRGAFVGVSRLNFSSQIKYQTFGEYQSVVRNIRREEVVLARLRLGHTKVTHSYLLQGEEHPQCVGCDAPFTVRHFLLECGDFAQVRNNCFHVDNMKELFQDIHIDSIMTFLGQVGLFNKI